MITRVGCAGLLLLVAHTSLAAVPLFGTNGHDNWTTTTYDGAKADRVFRLLNANHLRTYRVDLRADPRSNETLARLVSLGKRYDVVVRPMLYVDRLDGDDAFRLMARFAHDVPIWEFGNELNLRGPAGFDDAIAEMKVARSALVRASKESGAKLRSTLNVAAFAGASGKGLNLLRTSYPFLDRAVSQGLDFDYISLHYYPQPADLERGWVDAYLAPLRAYGKKVLLNEINCGEIYHGDDGNSDSCLRTLDGLVRHVVSDYADLVSEVAVYELLDDPATSGIERHFGMMYDIDHPKRSLALMAGFAAKAKSDTP